MYGKSENELVLSLIKINPSPPNPSETVDVNVPEFLETYIIEPSLDTVYPDKLEFKSLVNSVAILSVVIDDAFPELELSRV